MGARRIIGLALAVVITTTALPSGRAAPNDSTWYGWQIMAPDAVGIASLTAAAKVHGRTADVFATIGWVMMGFDGSVVHLAHKRVAAAATSLSLRVAGALFAGLVYVGGTVGSRKEPVLGQTLLAGAIAATTLAIDWWLLAKTDSAVDPAPVGIMYGWSF